jgi:hypothetical protein
MASLSLPSTSCDRNVSPLALKLHSNSWAIFFLSRLFDSLMNHASSCSGWTFHGRRIGLNSLSLASASTQI